MRRWLVLLAVLTGCADATTYPTQMPLDADAGVAPEAGVDSSQPPHCPVNQKGSTCIGSDGKRTFMGRYACAYGLPDVGCTYTDGTYQVIIVAKCDVCGPPGS